MTTIVLNNKLLFIGELKKTNAYGIVIVGSSNYKLTHISTMKLTLSNDNRNIIDIIILKVLFFITLPVIILSISQISLIFSHGHWDNSIHTKSIFNQSYFFVIKVGTIK